MHRDAKIAGGGFLCGAVVTLIFLWTEGFFGFFDNQKSLAELQDKVFSLEYRCLSDYLETLQTNSMAVAELNSCREEMNAAHNPAVCTLDACRMLQRTVPLSRKQRRPGAMSHE